MKQLRIEYTIYDQHDKPRLIDTFTTSFYGELPESILKSALSLLKHSAGDGHYVILSIQTIDL